MKLDPTKLELYNKHLNFSTPSVFLGSLHDMVAISNMDTIIGSQIIEAMLLNLPVQSLVYDHNINKFVIGEMTLKYIKTFIDGKFALTKLDFLSMYNDNFFGDLDGSSQRRIVEQNIHFYGIAVNTGPAEAANFIKKFTTNVV